MATYLPITLVGNSLGERHRYLNALVNDAYQKKVSFQSIQDAPELSAVDRLFKIDLASKLRVTEYILSNLKDDDMLYVSRALQSSWLLEPKYNDVINPAYLDKVLYPDMITTAVNKMNNWLHVRLKDPNRCLEFFQYFSEKNFDLALKFLWSCDKHVIADAISRAFEKITPKRLKLLCEKCPRAVRIYYYEFMTKEDASYRDWYNESQYYRSLTNLINTDSNLLLDIAEQFYNPHRCSPFSSRITQVIMSKHKDRYVKKPELYAAWLLHTPTLAKCLNNDEIKDIVLKLARAEYLGGGFFSYKRVEPFIKQLTRDEREAFKKVVFVDKKIGDKIKDWPYTPPTSPYPERLYEIHVFEDNKYEKHGYYNYDDNCNSMAECFESGYCMRNKAMCRMVVKEETVLDKLFNKYRFLNFTDTFIELSKQIPAESLVQTREYMMLVLVSKSGGVEDNVRILLKLLTSRHNNEAENFRATIVRSLVKRAKAWQLPNDLWQMLLLFAHGLGLDGEKCEEKCLEGLHAVVLRNILLAEDCSPKVFSAFIKQFSTFAEYSLNEEEKRKVAEKLPSMLLASAKEQAKISEAVIRLEAVMRVLNDYSLKIKDYPEAVPVISMFAHKDSKACVGLLKHLYDARIARKDLFRENYKFLQSNESYLNVLRHDSQILKETDEFEKQAGDKIDHDEFLRKLAIYFSENDGLAEKYLSKLEKEIDKNPRADLVRSFAILSGLSLFKELREVDKVVKKTAEQKRLAVALRTYGHLARPKLDLNALGWRKAGVKAVANQISICSANKVEEHVRLLSDWKRAPRLRFLLARRIDKEVEILALIVRFRPTVAIKLTFRHLNQMGEGFKPKIWEIGKAALEKSDLSHPKYLHLRNTLSKLNETPESLRADYGSAVYRVFKKISRDEGMRILTEIEDYLSKADEKFISDVINEFLNNEMTFENTQTSDYHFNTHAYLILRIIAKHLMLCKSEDIQKQKMETVCKPFLRHMKEFLSKTNDIVSQCKVFDYWNNFMFNLKCTDVFMDISYVSFLPVMQHIVEWLKETVSIVEHINTYITMHLIMLYFKAVRQSVKQNPEIFANKKKRNEIGVEIVGVMLGKYIAHEIVQLKTEYFESIVEMYAKVLNNYLSVAFHSGNSKWAFVSALVRGILEEHDSTARLLAENVFIVHRHFIKDIKGDKTLELLEGFEDIQLNFFMNADLQEIFVE